MKKKVLLINVSLFVLFAACICIFIFVIIPQGVAAEEKADYGFIRLPNRYCIVKISANNNYLGRAQTVTVSGAQQTAIMGVVDFDINAIAWNSRYVLYHISNHANTAHRWPDSKRFQILDTVNGNITTYRSLVDAKTGLKKYSADSLKLKSIEDYFPETKGSSHALTLRLARHTNFI